ncbi:kinase-like protein [Metschnikowia bicuspidata var. bicuspidata NRRL YB-4993]|uniref:Kinase-like protein n=1 Tax=Metschnikowia bicuspidata var. bicuspidata NRRL YB-4993 TaxID=869754 RepID=A0A1A0H719_9ASCO|nr:kinase-like protein [Metschnikowia bicuspidata var. bicuspidata NRRL YB-4993]OBA19702.1 kinase-like protein [Metschnikowia bicuspidata var. bicuspidata NRRL YB-4993]
MCARRKHHYAVLATKKRPAARPAGPPGSAPSAPCPETSPDQAPRRADVYTRLYAGTKKARLAAARPRRTPSPAHAKPASAAQMYELIRRLDALLFAEPNSLDAALEEQQPVAAAQLIDAQDTQLSVYERGEMMRNAHVYYVPPAWTAPGCGSAINVSSFKNNYGFDDADGNYVVRPQDHVAYRYEIVRVLGTGSFGNVVHCRDHRYAARGRWRNVAIKVIKNELDWLLQAVSEVKMLKHLAAAQAGRADGHVLTYCDHFHFRGHMCIVSELLSLNLYTLLELGQFRGVALALVRSFARKILAGLRFVHAQHVIHCDIKPENIMIRLPPDYCPGAAGAPDFQVKLIDFGSSCLETETSFSYIQSRFYRAPEVILGARYGPQIDVWSFGCVLAELFAGSPLLPGRNELEQIALVLEMFGAPPSALVLAERKRLLRSVRTDMHRKLNDPLVSGASVFSSKPAVQVDERKLKKTLLYTLFNLDGKINLPFLNLQLQACEPKDQPASALPAPFKRNVKLSSRSLDVSMRLHSSHEDKSDQAAFSRFMGLVFQWDPAVRPTAAQLLDSPFLQDGLGQSAGGGPPN